MADHVYPILLVDDDINNVQLIQKLFADISHFSLAQDLSFSLTIAKNLSQALKMFETETYSAIILDLTLPDTQGFDALLKIRRKVPHTAIIVKIVEQDEATIVRAFQMGAGGYFRIQDLDASLLLYSLRIAIERQQYIQILSQQQQQQELASLETLAQTIQPSITARMFGSSAIKESIPEVFDELVERYGKLLDLCLEEKIFKVKYDISGELRNLASKLGFVKASPRDIVEIHTKALKEKCENVNLAKVQAYVEESRLRLLELMGYLTSYYRKYYIGLSNLNVFSSSDSEIN